MELTAVRIVPSPLSAGRTRIAGDVTYDDRPGRAEEHWFEVPERLAGSLSDSGNPWLAALLPLAAFLGQPLRLCRPVDRTLRTNAASLLQIWRGWYPELHVVPIEAETKEADPGPNPRKTAALFSGGVDSFFTVLRNAEAPDRKTAPEIDWLLWVWGFDLPLDAAEASARLRERLSAAARDLGKELIDVRTNLRETRIAEAGWGRLAHGCLLASVGLIFERRLRAVYVAATHSTGSIVPWGSHPETDPLLSTAATRIIHDGSDTGRSEKTAFISRSPVAMRSLHVCFRSPSSDNCGRCRKCLLTMVTLELTGALARCEVFPDRRLDARRIERIFVDSAINEVIFRDLEARARRSGRSDIANALGRSLIRSRRLRRVMRAARWLGTRRGLWRFARPLREAVFARAIR